MNGAGRVLTGAHIALLLCALVTNRSVAQDAYPNRTVKIIAPVAPGAVADLVGGSVRKWFEWTARAWSLRPDRRSHAACR